MRSLKADDIRRQFLKIETHIGSSLEELDELPIRKLTEEEYSLQAYKRQLNGTTTSGVVFMFVDHEGNLLRHVGPALTDFAPPLFTREALALLRNLTSETASVDTIGNQAWPSLGTVLSVLEVEQLSYILHCKVTCKGQEWSVLSLPKPNSKSDFDPREDVRQKIAAERAGLTVSLNRILSTGQGGVTISYEAFAIRMLFSLLGVDPEEASGLSHPENISCVRVLAASPKHRERIIPPAESPLSGYLKALESEGLEVGVTSLFGNYRFFREAQLVEDENPLARATWALRIPSGLDGFCSQLDQLTQSPDEGGG